MELFSKRNPNFYRSTIRTLIRETSSSLSHPRSSSYQEEMRERKNKFLPQRLRNRLQMLIKFLANSDEYFENFILIKNTRNGTYYLNDFQLSQLGLRELGYDISKILNCEEMDFNTEAYSDLYLLDLIELLIIFSKDKKKAEIVNRFQNILNEEDSAMIIHNYMLFKKESSSLSSVISLVKDKALKGKLTELYSNNDSSSAPEIKARIVADITQLIFSSDKKGKTKSYTEDLSFKIASKWTSKENEKDLADLINTSVKNAKQLNNEISNIRHTDRNRIPITSPSLYKLIAANNLSLIELVIESLPEEYLSDKDSADLKNSYVKEYKISKDELVMESYDSTDISVEDIPF